MATFRVKKLRPPATFGARLRRLRAELGWSQEDLAFEAEVSQSLISAYERDSMIP